MGGKEEKRIRGSKKERKRGRGGGGKKEPRGKESIREERQGEGKTGAGEKRMGGRGRNIGRKSEEEPDGKKWGEKGEGGQGGREGGRTRGKKWIGKRRDGEERKASTLLDSDRLVPPVHRFHYDARISFRDDHHHHHYLLSISPPTPNSPTHIETPKSCLRFGRGYVLLLPPLVMRSGKVQQPQRSESGLERVVDNGMRRFRELRVSSLDYALRIKWELIARKETTIIWYYGGAQVVLRSQDERPSQIFRYRDRHVHRRLAVMFREKWLRWVLMRLGAGILGLQTLMVSLHRAAMDQLRSWTAWI
ncbi:hypothetical protein Tco_0685942 [Tanacetum coccineum]